MNCSNPCNILDELRHSKVTPVNIVKEEMAMGTSNKNSLEIDKTLEHFCNNGVFFFFINHAETKVK